MMKPVAFISLALFCLVYVGNACMKTGFVAQSVGDSVKISSCASDESTLNRTMGNDMQQGYIGERPISYSTLSDESIIVEGDMIVRTKGGALPRKPVPAGISQGVGVPAGKKWPGTTIPYKIPVGFPDKYRIDEAINHWNSNMDNVVRFVPWTNETNYANIVEAANGCASIVGFQNLGAHEVAISDQCSSGNVIHELGHVIGLQHEQNRLDRNSFVDIIYDNIQTAAVSNFNVSNSYVNYMTYDFGSIMHYALGAFAKVNGTNTIVPKVSVPSDIVVGQRVSLTLGDINSARAIYGAAPINVTNPTNPNPNGGTKGIAASYYQGVNFSDIRSSQLEETIDFNWGATAPINAISGSSFSMKLRGWLVPPETGSYRLKIVASGAFKVMLEGSKVFENTLNNERNEYVSKYYELTGASNVRILVEYKATGTENQLQLKWVKPGGVEEIIPKDQLVADPMGLNEMSNLCTISN